MIVYPAIDIRGGRCVRLVEGDFNRETAFDPDPVTAARRWADAGAEWLHVVDLDGAVAGAPVNHEAIARIRAAVDIPVQVGGGMRRLADVENLFAIGIDRVILGTVAVNDPEIVFIAMERWGDAVAVALDARDGRLATDGWLGQSEARAVDVARELASVGVRHFIVTDIKRDGTLRGPNIAGLGELVEAIDANVIASGGIATYEDLAAVTAAGAGGAIVGRALYDGQIDLRSAISTLRPVEMRG